MQRTNFDQQDRFTKPARLKTFSSAGDVPRTLFPMLLRRLTQLLALMMIGDGVSGLLKPRWHSLLWNVGPDLFQATMDELAKNPTNARLLYVTETLVGTWFSTRLTPEKPALV